MTENKEVILQSRIEQLEAENGTAYQSAKIAIKKCEQLEAEKAELIKFVELMYLYGGLSPELLSTKSDVIFYEADRLLKEHGVEI